MSDVNRAAADLAGQGSRSTQIRQVAADLFEEYGYSATTMATIAEAAGILPGSLYHHFASKEDIAVDILSQLDHELAEVAARVPSSDAATAEDRLFCLVADVISVSRRNAAAIRLRAFEPPTVATQKLHEARGRIMPTLEWTWQEVINGLTPRDPSNPQSADLLRFALKDLCMNTASDHPSDADSYSLARNTTEVLLHGIASHSQSDAQLDTSKATRAAEDAMARWPTTIETNTDTDPRTRIIAAARLEFARRGYDATTMRDIAKTAEVRMGSLYRRVRSKEELLTELISTFDEHFGNAINAVFEADDDEVATLDALAKVFVHARRRFRSEADITLFNLQIALGRALPFNSFRVHTGERLSLLVGLVERGVERGTMRDVASPASIAPHLRHPCWVPYEDVGVSEKQTHQFLRDSILRGYVRP